MCKAIRPVLITCVALSLPLAAARAAADWPQWRGPGRDGVAPSFEAPAIWPEAPSLRWKVTVGSGYSSPIVAGDRVYLQTRNGDGEEVLRCLDANTGRTIWRRSHPVPYEMSQAASSHGKGPKSTPVLSGDTICTLAINGVLSCHDARSGELKWRRKFEGRFKKRSPLFGAAASPLIDRGVLLAHVGGHDDGALTAFDAQTGKVVWRWNGDGPGYASPVIATLGGVRQVVTQTQEQIVGVDRAGGALLWSVPFETPYVQNIVTPVIFEDTVIVSGLEQGTMALRPVETDGRWSVETVWRNDEVSLYMSSPVQVGGRVCGLSHLRKGQFFCLDPRAGRTVWTSTGRDANQAAVLAAGDLMLGLTDAGELIVMRVAADSVSPVARYTVADSPTWAHPVPVGGDMLIKDASTLARWSFEGAPPAKPPGQR